MNLRFLNGFAKAVPFVIVGLNLALAAHGIHAVHNGDPGGPGGPTTMRMLSNGDPGGPGGPT